MEIEINICRICEEKNVQLINISNDECKWLIDKYIACAKVTVSCKEKFNNLVINTKIILFSNSLMYQINCQNIFAKNVLKN